MSETVEFSGTTKLPLSVERVLNNPEAVSLTEVVVLGWRPDGSFHFAGSNSDMARAMMLLACAQRWITDQYDLSGDKPVTTYRELRPAAVVVEMRQQGFTGNTCSSCGGARLVKSGHCETCQDCGTTTGCS